MEQGALTQLKERGAPTSSGVPRRVPPAPHRRRHLWPKAWHFLSFGAPGVLIYVCFVLAPIVISFWYSLTNYNPFNPPISYVGWDNYFLLFQDKEFLTALKVTSTFRELVPSIVILDTAEAVTTIERPTGGPVVRTERQKNVGVLFSRDAPPGTTLP